jgi:hypothetical protein
VDVAFSRESCQILDFGYNASRESNHPDPSFGPLKLTNIDKVAITPFTARENLYPEGTHGVLGYGVDPSSGVPTDSTLLGVYLPYDPPPSLMRMTLTRFCIAPILQLRNVVSNWAGVVMEAEVEYSPWEAEIHLRTWHLGDRPRNKLSDKIDVK